MKLKIKKGATVQVITGQDKGKKGEVLAIDTKNLLIKVQGVKMMTHFDKKEGQQIKEGFLAYSNVKLVADAPAKGKKAKSAKKSASKSA